MANQQYGLVHNILDFYKFLTSKKILIKTINIENYYNL